MKPKSTSHLLSLLDVNVNNIALKNLIGKVVYIDFWGTLCGAFLAALPDHLELQKKFISKDNIFLNVALQGCADQINEWKRFLANDNFPGIRVLAQGQFRNDEIQPFKINEIPTYVLIDKDGKLVTTKSSSPKHAEEITTELLK